MDILFIILIILASLLLAFFVLIQNPKGGGLDSSFGGSTVAGGVKNTNDFLDKSTWTLGAVLIILILMSSISFSGGAVGDSKLLDPNATMPAQPTVPAAANTENTTESTPEAEAPATSETSTPETTQE